MIDVSGLNYWAVIVAWVVFMAVGTFWYSPKGFGKLWSKLSGVDIMKIPQNEANRAILYVVGASFVQAVVLATILHGIGVGNATEGLVASLVLWFGLVAATTVGTTFYSRRSWKFWWLNASFFLVTMAINGMILGAWR